jgi:cell division protein FtsW (lipid II flippase)
MALADEPRSAAVRRRRVELALFAFAGVITASGMLLVEANQSQHHPATALGLWAAFFALLSLAHLAVRRLAPMADPLILPCVALLNGLGLVMIHRLDVADAANAVRAGEDVPVDSAPRQVVWTALGVLVLIGLLGVVRDHRRLVGYGYTCGVAGLALLILPGVLPSSVSEVNGAKLWLRLGPLSVQPGEFARVLIIVFVAAFLVAKRDLFTSAGKHFLGMTLPRPRDLAPLIAAWMIAVVVLVLEKELGASLLFFGVVLVMIYLATSRVSWLLIGLLFFAAGCFAGYHLFGHVRARVSVWGDPFAHYSTSGYQVSEALFGFATGGLGGTGLGAGRPDTVPFANTDFISAAIGEELGLIGLSMVLLVYLLLVTRGVHAALAARDTFGKLLAGGASFSMTLQLFVVVGGVTTLIPLTGMTMPFLSYGGSSLLANYALVALLLRISGHQGPPRRRAPPLAQASTELVSVDRPALRSLRKRSRPSDG